MEEDRLDLSLLAQEFDERRWESLILQTAERCWQAREERISVPRLITRWAVPWIGLTAVAAAAVWLVALRLPEPASTAPGSDNADPAFEVASWASTGEVPATSEVLSTFEDFDGTH